MKKVLILGAGNIGKAIAYDLNEDFDLTIGDSSEEALDKLSRYGEKVVIDARDKDSLIAHFENADVVVCALPGEFGLSILETGIETGTDVVDVSFMPEDPFPLNEQSKEENVSLIVDAGFGPGIPNIMVGRLNHIMDNIESCKIKIGGLPKEPKPPLFHTVTWSPMDLIEEYTRPARLVRDGKISSVETFDEIRPVTVQERSLEEFYSDGLRTLLHTIKADVLEETTLRWKGHLEKVKVLKELGFFDKKHRENTLKVILQHMQSDVKDISLLEVDIKGVHQGEVIEAGYSLYDEAHGGFSSMSRTTGFTTALMTRLVLKGDIAKGVLPLELLGSEKLVHDYVLRELKARGVKITTKGHKLHI